ncbi:endonuclease/exonuclease/phosphatase family protein [Brevibacterium sp. FAM 24638]|uniref:endonuclease/exonuclease/phosphatase family protein n=1 Tax=unclassified Brevibacterium TaxID=2614124 RepID=UPI003C7C0C18
MVTIGTWNLENFFKPGSDGGPKTKGEYAKNLDALAAIITDLAPDVLAVQEVGDPEALTGRQSWRILEDRTRRAGRSRYPRRFLDAFGVDEGRAV